MGKDGMTSWEHLVHGRDQAARFLGALGRAGDNSPEADSIVAPLDGIARGAT